MKKDQVRMNQAKNRIENDESNVGGVIGNAYISLSIHMI